MPPNLKRSLIKLADEKGLFLLININGAKYWRFKYRFNAKEKLLALGVYPDANLSEAREKRDVARNHLANGIDLYMCFDGSIVLGLSVLMNFVETKKPLIMLIN